MPTYTYYLGDKKWSPYYSQETIFEKIRDEEIEPDTLVASSSDHENPKRLKDLADPNFFEAGVKYLMDQMWERQKNILYNKAFPQQVVINQSLMPLGNQNGNKTQNAVWLFLVNYWRRIDGSYLKCRIKKRTTNASPLKHTMDPGTSFHALGLPHNLFQNLGCYGFFEKGKCLYVGQASNPAHSSIGNRIQSHFNQDRVFTQISDEIKIWFPTFNVGPGNNANKIRDLESLLILLYDPTHNIQRPTRGHKVNKVLDYFESKIKELAN